MTRVVVERCVRSSCDGESAEVTFLLSGHRLTAETRQWFEDDWDRLRPGAAMDVELRLQRWYDERGTLTRVPDEATRDSVVAIGRDSYRVTGPVVAFDEEDHPTVSSFRARVEVGLGEPLDVLSYLGPEIEGLTIGDRVTTEGVLEIWPQSPGSGR